MDETEITKALQKDLEFYRVKLQVKRKEDRLNILVTRHEANDVDYSVLFEMIQGSLNQLSLSGIDNFTVYGRLAGSDRLEWQQAGKLQKLSEDDDSEPFEVGNLRENAGELEIPDYHQESVTVTVPTVNSSGTPPAWKKYIVPSSIAILAVAAGGGWVVFDNSRQAQKLADAQAIAAKSLDPSQIGKLSALSETQKELQKATTLLAEIPNRIGAPYGQAQVEIAKLQPKLDAANQKIAAEKAASDNLESAKKLAYDASLAVQNPPHKSDVWLSAQSKWQAAIKSLEQVKPGTFAYADAQQKLDLYRQNYVVITAQVQRQKREDDAVAIWAKRLSAGIQTELQQLKAGGTQKAEFISKCTASVRPELSPYQLRQQGYQVIPFSNSLCESIWETK